MRKARRVAAAVLLAATAFGSGWTLHGQEGTYCPTEDSCKVVTQYDGVTHGMTATVVQTVP